MKCPQHLQHFGPGVRGRGSSRRATSMVIVEAGHEHPREIPGLAKGKGKAASRTPKPFTDCARKSTASRPPEPRNSPGANVARPCTSVVSLASMARSGVWDGTRNGAREDAARSWQEPGFSQEERHPVVCVSWEDSASVRGPGQG